MAIIAMNGGGAKRKNEEEDDNDEEKECTNSRMCAIEIIIQQLASKRARTHTHTHYEILVHTLIIQWKYEKRIEWHSVQLFIIIRRVRFKMFQLKSVLCVYGKSQAENIDSPTMKLFVVSAHPLQ